MPEIEYILLIFVAIMIVFFTYFYTAVSMNIGEMSDNIKKYGGFIPGLRPGKPTTDYLDKIMSRITMAGAVFLALVAVMPNLIVWTGRETYCGISNPAYFDGRYVPRCGEKRYRTRKRSKKIYGRRYPCS